MGDSKRHYAPDCEIVIPGVPLAWVLSYAGRSSSIAVSKTDIGSLPAPVIGS